jgi:hypothetical protein
MKPPKPYPTHDYGPDDHVEDNRHEHAMGSGQMAAMFAKMAQGGGTGSGTGHAKQGSLGSGGAKDKVKSERVGVAGVGDLFGFLEELLEGEDHGAALIPGIRFFFIKAVNLGSSRRL